MTRRRAEPTPHYQLNWTVAARDDVVQLSQDVGTEVAAAALAAAADIQYGQRRGNALGARSVTGNLSGLYRVKFDLPGQRPERFRLVYRHRGSETKPLEAIEIIVAGPRDEHEVYHVALARLSGK